MLIYYVLNVSHYKLTDRAKAKVRNSPICKHSLTIILGKGMSLSKAWILIIKKISYNKARISLIRQALIKASASKIKNH